MGNLLAIDPGTSKHGIAIFKDNKLLSHEIIRNPFEDKLKEIIEKESINQIALGNSTNHKAFLKFIEILNIKFELIDEKNSTYLARALYFENNPPKGLKRFLPKGLLYPEQDIDDYAAIIIGKRYLKIE